MQVIPPPLLRFSNEGQRLLRQKQPHLFRLGAGEWISGAKIEKIPQPFPVVGSGGGRNIPLLQGSVELSQDILWDEQHIYLSSGASKILFPCKNEYIV